jgi:hypothetical protein
MDRGSRPVDVQLARHRKEPILRFPLPLQPGDKEPTIALNQMLQDIYDQASLDLVIDYGQQPIPAVTAPDFQWIQFLLSA